MRLKKPRSVMILLIMLMTFAAVLPGTSYAIEGVDGDLFYLAPDASDVMQLWRIGIEDRPAPVTFEANDIIAFDVSYDKKVAYITERTIVAQGSSPVNSGGPLDSPTVTLVDVVWSPDASLVAVTALNPDAEVGSSDPAEGIWLLELETKAWILMLTSARPDAASTQVYTAAQWSPAGDRLLLDVTFGEGSGVAMYNINTQELLVYNLADTNGLINHLGYGVGAWSPDGASVVLSDVPLAETGNGYILSANDYTRIVPIATADAGALYVSHPLITRTGVLYLMRDLVGGDSVTQIWENTGEGARQLGALPTANIDSVAWAGDGSALLYLDGFDGRTGTPHLLVRTGSTFSDRTLPAGVEAMNSPQWSMNLPNSQDQAMGIVITTPHPDQQSGTGGQMYIVESQWNPVQGATSYRITISPALNGQSEFDINGTAVQMVFLPCGTSFSYTVTALDASGNPKTPSEPVNFATPTCGGEQPAPAAAPTDPPAQAEQPESDEGQPTPAEQTSGQAPAATPEPVTPASVVDLTATAPTPGAPADDGTVLYSTVLTWTKPQESYGLFIVRVDPPLGANQRASFPVRSEEQLVTTPLGDLVCGVTYSVQVQTMAEDGIVVLATSSPTTVTAPCP